MDESAGGQCGFLFARRGKIGGHLMRRVISVLMAVGALLFAATDAFAGGSLKDTAPLAEAGRCVGGAFSGAYAGIQLGGGSMSSHQSLPGATGITLPSDSAGGFTIGGYDGYNVQCGRALFGIESDFNYFGADTKSNFTGVCSPCGGDLTVDTKSELNWFGTLRGRLGLVSNENLLIYATGGLAYGDVDHRFSTNIGPSVGGFPTILNPEFSGSSGGTQFGWTAGGGVEFLRSGNWSLKADALYVDLGSESHTYTLNDSCAGVCTQKARYDDTFWVARVGLAYHFGAREAAVVPLK